jgi:hypothetical protein
MKIGNVELKDTGYKPEESGQATEVPKTNSSEKEIHYPSMSVSDKPCWNDLPLDLTNFKAGEKAVLIAIVNIKEKTVRENESEGKKDSKKSGCIEFLKVGLRQKEKSNLEEENEELDEYIDKL